MRLTAKGRFAVTAMVDLALRQNRGPVTLAAISERQRISLSYLEQLFGKLRRAKLVSSVRGPGGGYNLAQPAPGITVADIVTAVDEPLDATQCGGKENCHDEKRCMTHDLWATLNEKMYEYLSSVTLADLVAHQSGKPVAVIKESASMAPRAMPKSATFTRPSGVSSRLPGLTSRWTTPRAWAAARPIAASPARRHTSSGSRTSRVASSWRRLCPGTSSITR